MNAPNSISQDKRATERNAYEPSMEEILASIRRIIADDQAVVSRRPPQEPPESRPQMTPPQISDSDLAASPSVADEIEEDLPVKSPEPAYRAEPSAEALKALKVEARVETRAEAWAPREAERPHEVDRTPEIPSATAGLANLAKMSSFGREAQTDRLAMPKEAPKEDRLVSPATGAAVSSSFTALAASRFLNDHMSDMVREMLRPMLKAWLDDNLPVLVERLVRAEIERVARGGP